MENEKLKGKKNYLRFTSKTTLKKKKEDDSRRRYPLISEGAIFLFFLRIYISILSCTELYLAMSLS